MLTIFIPERFRAFTSVVFSNACVQVLSRVAALVLSMVLARLLGPENFGIFSVNYTFVSVAAIFVCIGLPVFLTREIAVLTGKQGWGLAWTTYKVAIRVVLATSAFAVAVFLAVYLSWPEFRIVSGGPVFLGALVLLILTSVLRLSTGVLRGLKKVSTSLFLETVLLPALVLLGVSAVYFVQPDTLSAQTVIYLYAFVTLAVFLIAQNELRRPFPNEGMSGGQRVEWKSLLRDTLPFSLIGAAAVLNSYADILMLAWFVPTSEVGFYRVASQAAVLITFGLQIAQLIGAPIFAQLNEPHLRDKLSSEFRRFRILSGSVALVLFSIITVFGDELLTLFFGEPFAAAYVPLVLLSAGYCVNASFGPLGILLSMSRQEKLVSRVLWVAAGMNILLNLTLIPSFGLIGAATATSLTVAAVHPFLWVVAKRKKILQ